MFFVCLRPTSCQTGRPDRLPFALLALSPIHGAVDVGVENARLLIDAIECARFDQAFDHAFVHCPKIDTFAEIENGR